MTDRIKSRISTARAKRLSALPRSNRHAARAPRGNALVLVAGVLLLLAVMGMAYIVRTQGAGEIASATQTRSLLDSRIDAIAGSVIDEVTTSLFVKPIVPPGTVAEGGDPGLLAANNAPGIRPMARSDWPRRPALPTSTRYGIDPLDYLTNLLDPGNLNTVYTLGSDGYPDGFNFAPYSVKPWTNWPDHIGVIYGESNPLGNPGYGDHRWLASFEPQRATRVGNDIFPDPLGSTFSHWAHLSWLPTAENGYRVVPDISDVVNNARTGTLGTPLIVPADPAQIPVNSGLAALGIPYEQWLPSVPPTPLTNASDFIQRRNNWFTPGGYALAVTEPFGGGNSFPDSSRMLPNFIRLADPFGTGTLLAPGTRPTDVGPTRFLANGQPDDANNTIRNIIERTLADTDGDGFTDSFWYLAPTSVDRGVRHLVALRIIDNSAMLNLNVATRFQRRNQVPATALAPATRETRGHTPGDLALVSDLDQLDTPVGFFNSPDNQLPTGFFASSPQMTVAFDTANRWAGTAETNPTFLRERGFQRSSAYPANAPGAWSLFGEQLRLQSERLRAFKSNFEDGQVRFYHAPAGTLPIPPLDPTAPGYSPGGFTTPLSPFTVADEVELRMSHGQNQPFILSRLERALNADANAFAYLRSAQTREEANEWSGKQLSAEELLVDNRRKITTISGARNELMPPALWTRWWNVDNGRLRPIDPNQPLPWYGPPELDDLPFAYPTLAQLQADLGTADPPAYAAIPASQVFTLGGWRPEVIRAVAGDANNDGVFDARDLDAARRDFFLWNAKLDLRAPIDLNRVGGQNPVVDPVYGIFGAIDGGVLVRGPGSSATDSYDHAFSINEWTRDFRRRALSSLKSEYRGPIDSTTGLPIRTVSSYADRFQVGSDMPSTGFQTLTGTNRPRSIVADGQSGQTVDTALKSEKITNAMAASLAANAAVARRGPQFIGPFTTGPGGQVLGSWFTSQPLLPSFAGVNPALGNIPDTRLFAEDPDPTLPGSAPPGGAGIAFSGIEAHPVVMEAFFAVVWPKTRLGSSWQFVMGTTNPSVIAPKPADPYSIPGGYNDSGNESHFVAIVPADKFVDQLYDWSTAAPNAWQRQSTAVVAVQVANPFPYPIRLADYRLEIFGQTYQFPLYETDVNGNIIRYPYDLDGDGQNDPIPLMLGPTTEAEPRTAIVFAITDHNQINYRPGDSDQLQRRYPLTKGVEFDPFFRARWLDYLDIVEANDLGGANPGLQSAGLAGAPASAFCPHNQGVWGNEDSQATLTSRFPRRRLLGSSRPSSVLFGCQLNANNPIAQSKILDATQEIGTDVAAFRPELGIQVRRVLRNPETGVQLGTVVVDRFDRDPGDTDQSSADPVSGWNISMAAALLLEEDGRFWPPPIDLGHSSNEDQMWPLLNSPPPPPPAPQPPPPWHLKPQQSGTFNGIRIDTNDYYVTWTRSSRLWGKDFAVVYGLNGDPVAYDRWPTPGNNGKGDNLITPDERAPRYVFASSKQRPDLPLDGSATSGAIFADGQGPFRGRNNSETYRGAAFQAQVGLTPWVQDFTFNYANPAPYPLPTILKNPANSNPADQGSGDPDLVGTLFAGIPLKGNHLLPLIRNYTVSLTAENASGSNWPPSNGSSNLNDPILRVAMKPTSFTTRTVVGLPSGEVNPRQIFGLPFNALPGSGVSSPITFVADKGMRPPVLDTNMETEVSGGVALARAIDRLLPMDGAFVLGHRQEDFDTIAEVKNLMVWGPVSELGGATRHTLGEILTDRVPGYPVGLVHRYVDVDGDGRSFPEEQSPAWPFLNRIHVDNPSIAFSWFDRNGNQASPPQQRFLTQWGGAAGAVGAFASSLPQGTRLIEAFTMDDRGTALVEGNYGALPPGADLDGDGVITTNELAQWLEDRRFRLAGGFTGRGTPGLINVNTAPVEVLRALPHMSQLVYNDSTDLDGDGVNDLADLDTNNDGLLDAGRQPPLPAANPFVRVADSIDLYRSRTPSVQNWAPSGIYPSRPFPGNTAAMPHYFDRGQSPPPSTQYQDIGFFPGMRAERGFDSLGETMLLTRGTAAPNGGPSSNWGWNDNQSWSVRFAGLDPFRRAQASAANELNVGGGYRQLNANPSYPAPPYGARISTDAFRTRRMEASLSGNFVELRETPMFAPTYGDALDQNLLLSSLSNILTTRSDVFTVYLRVRSVKADPITGRYDGTDPQLIVDDSRYVIGVDRTQVERPGDAPRILFFQKVPH
ncbi:MAG: hypothetical protein KF724_05275 [Phycisphaeraceae bacterium]|nr:hypothetical protein [Phycisphaeraceae bacterium]